MQDYPKSFDDLFSAIYSCSEEDKFIGQGNPASSILIIAKEWGMDTKDKNGNFTIPFLRGIRDNFKDWRDNRHPTVANWFDVRFDWSQYHPLQPYKGQVMKRDNHKDIEHTNRGTSATWIAYQKFINEFLPQDFKVGAGEPLNFYDYCFISELSSYCMPMSKQMDGTRQSIEARILKPDGILRQRFFKEFPVIILSCYKYIDQYEIPIMDCFNDHDMGLEYEYKGIIVSEEGYRGNLPLYNGQFSNYPLAKGEFINVHEGLDANGQKHLMLHTSHFQRKTDFWIKQLADVVRPDLSKK